MTWQEIAAKIAAQIEAGELAQGARVPSGDDLATQLGVSRHTAHRAIEELQVLGLVVRQRRWGTVVASRQAKKKSIRIALVVDRFAPMVNFPSADMLRGFQDTLGEDAQVVVAEAKGDWETEARVLKRLQREVDGIAIVPTAHARNTSLLQKIADSEPLVAIDRLPEGLHCDAVVSDNIESTAHAVQMLVNRGHTRMGFFSFNKPDFSSVLERHGAWKSVLESSGVSDVKPYERWFPRELEAQPEHLFQAVHDALFALTRGSEPITALFCVQDAFAMSAQHVSDKIGLQIPEDLEVALFNDWPPMLHRAPWSLHRIVQRTGDIGRLAAQTLLRRMNGDRSEVGVIKVPAEFHTAYAGIPVSPFGLMP